MNNAFSFIKKYKRFIIAATGVIILLAVAFISGGKLKGGVKSPSSPSVTTASGTVSVSESRSTSKPASTTIATTDPVKKQKASQKSSTTGSTSAETKSAQNNSKPTPATHESKTTKPISTTPVNTEPREETTPQKPKCTFSISCATILNHMDELDEDKHELVPGDGWIYSPSAVIFEEGDSVYDILLRVCRENNIQLESEWTPVYNSAYISGINNLYEFDCGRNSGWTYFVNDAFPNIGVSKYYPQNNDVIRFCYTCVKGDVGAQIE